VPTDTYILAAGADDAHEDADGTGFSATATTVQTNYRVSASSRRHSGFRFDNIGIPPGSTIVSAYLMPVVASSVDNDLQCNVYLHDVDDSQNFTDLADVTTRIGSGATTANVDWDAPNVGGIGDRVTSPNLATPVQEVIDRAGWAVNNALTVLLRADTEDSGNCHFASFENTTYDPAHLQITWTEPQTSFSLKVDLDDDGDFADAAEDVTSNAWLAPGRGVITFRGNDAARRGWEPRGGSLLFELLNEDGTYDRDTTTLTEHDPAKLTATFGSTLYQVWTGRTSQVEYHPELRRQSVSVAAQGALARFGNRSGASSAVFASVTIDTAIGHLLDAAGFDKNVADYCITDLAFDAYYGLGETSGDALDGTANGNDLTVTSAAARDATALDDGGDGSIEFDGALTKLEAAVDVLDNMWDGGGALAFTFDADSDGEGSVGIVAGKVGWSLNVQDESAGNLRLNFTVDFDGAADGTWQTAVDIPITSSVAGVLIYDSDAVGNNPTIILSTDGATIDTLTVRRPRRSARASLTPGRTSSSETTRGRPRPLTGTSTR
jgi:hypothetical protein